MLLGGHGRVPDKNEKWWWTLTFQSEVVYASLLIISIDKLCGRMMFLEIHHILTRYCINHKSMYMRRSDRLTLQCNSFQHSPRSLRASAWSPNHTLPITERSRTMNRSTGYAEYDTSHFFNLPTYLNTEKGGTKIRRKSDLIMGLNYQRSVGLVGVGFFFFGSYCHAAKRNFFMCRVCVCELFPSAIWKVLERGLLRS